MINYTLEAGVYAVDFSHNGGTMEFQKAFLVDREKTAEYPDEPVEILGVVFAPKNRSYRTTAEPQLCYHVVAGRWEDFVPVADIENNPRRYQILCEETVLDGLHSR